MAAVDTDEYASPDLQRKRSRPSNVPDEELTPKPPTKIKLSLKLGTLRTHAPPTLSDLYAPVERGSLGLASTLGGSSNTGGSDDEHVDIDDHSRYLAGNSRHLASPGAHTPRIKLRLSLKSATPVETPRLSLKSAAYEESPLGSTGPGSPAESAASLGSPGFRSRLSSTAQLVYSPTQASDADSDDAHDGSYNDSDGAYDHLPPTPHSAGPRRRGRPPLRGRRSSSIARRQTMPPAPVRSASGSFTTTVSLKSSLQRLIKRIRKRDSYGFFLEPVDTAVVSDYLGVIAQPMDLGTMLRKADAGTYRSIAEFRSDLLLVCANARKYNGAGSIYAKSADRVQEYALVAIDRETVKLERVGKASLPDNGADYRSRTASVSPSRYSVADDYSDSHTGNGAYPADAGMEFRRSSRLRWRGASEPQQSTPASIVDSFKWSATSKKKPRKTNVPKRHTDAQKLPLAADGSIDSGVFEDDVARIPFEQAHTALPLLVLGARPQLPPRSSADGAAWPTYAHGRYYQPATHLDFGPLRGLQTTAAAYAGIDSARHTLSAVHGDALGLAYWRSVSEFIDGAGGEVSKYASAVMDHLSNGTHAVARNALRHLGSRRSDSCSTEPAADAGDTGDQDGIDIPELVAWLDSQPERERLAAQRSEALTTSLLLRDVSARCASGENKAPRPDILSVAQRHDLFASNSRALKSLHEQQLAGSVPAVSDIDALDAGIYALAEHACLAAGGTKQPTTLVPRASMPARPLASRPLLAPAATSVPLSRGGVGRALVPRPSRAVSTPSLPTLHSASLASAVRSELMDSLAHDSGSDRGYPL